jgi:hypothetical protein
MTGLPRISDIWQGRLTPPSHCSYQGIRAPHYDKEYRGNTRGPKIYGCFSRQSPRNAS